MIQLHSNFKEMIQEYKHQAKTSPHVQHQHQSVKFLSLALISCLDHYLLFGILIADLFAITEQSTSTPAPDDGFKTWFFFVGVVIGVAVGFFITVLAILFIRLFVQKKGTKKSGCYCKCLFLI